VEVVFLCGRILRKSNNIGGKTQGQTKLLHRISANLLMEKTYLLLLGAFAKLRKATISFVLSVCPSARMEQRS